MGLDPALGHDHDVVVKKDTNLKYRKSYCKSLASNAGARGAHAKLVESLNEAPLKVGYDLAEWGECQGHEEW